MREGVITDHQLHLQLDMGPLLQSECFNGQDDIYWYFVVLYKHMKYYMNKFQ